MTDRGRQILARLATLESVRLIAAREGDPRETLEEIRRVLNLDALMEEEGRERSDDGGERQAA